MNKDLEVYRGDTSLIICTIKRNRVALDLTGYNIIMTVKEKYADPDASILFTATGTIPQPATGVGYISLSESNTDREDKKYVYDIKIYKTDKSDIKTILSGVFTVKPVARREVPTS